MLPRYSTTLRSGMFRRTPVVNNNLKIYKDKLTLYTKLEKIVATVKTVTMAKFLKAQERVPIRDQSVRFSKKLFQIYEDDATVEPSDNILWVPLTTNRGSCGALNSRQVKLVADCGAEGWKQQVSVYGRKGYDSFPRTSPEALQSGLVVDTPPGWIVASCMTEHLFSNQYDYAKIMWTRFHNSANQEWVSLTVPKFEKWCESITQGSLEGNPAGAVVQNDRLYGALASLSAEGLRELYEFHVALVINHAIEENALSELAARMVAVENQLQNITKLKIWAQLIYNKTRQAAVTGEMLELTNAKTAVDDMLAAAAAAEAAKAGEAVWDPLELTLRAAEVSELSVSHKLLAIKLRSITTAAAAKVQAALQARVVELKEEEEQLSAVSASDAGHPSMGSWRSAISAYFDAPVFTPLDSKLQSDGNTLLAGGTVSASTRSPTPSSPPAGGAKKPLEAPKKGKKRA